MDNRFKSTERVSKKSMASHKYLMVTELPSGFRGYDIEEVYVRGLFFEESESLAKYVGDSEASYKQLIHIYRDVIQGIDIEDLEIPDFILLMIISSVWTVRDFGWVPNVKCVHTVINPYIKILKEANINLLASLEKATDTEDIKEFADNIKSNEEELEIAPELVKCQGVITNPIILDDLDIKDSLIESTPVPIKIDGKDYGIQGVTVKNKIQVDAYMEANPDAVKLFVTYASLLVTEDNLSLEEKINIIKFSPPTDMTIIKELDDKLFVSVKPVIKTCPSCMQSVKIAIGLTSLKAYP